MSELAALQSMIVVAEGGGTSGGGADVAAKIKSELQAFDTSYSRVDRETAKAILASKVLAR
jgi:hypothetical protein